MRRFASNMLLRGPRGISTTPRCHLSDAPIRPLTILSQEEQMLQESVGKFCQSDVAPLVRSMDEKGEIPKELFTKLFAQGFMGMENDPKYGGGGVPFMHGILTIEELAKVDPVVSLVVDIQNMNCAAIRTYGTEALKEKYLPSMAKDSLASFCLSEASSGSDAFSLKTTAKRVGSSYVINGTKMWITNSKEAEIFIVFANTDLSQSYKGITAFIVEKGQKGLTIGKKENKLGIRASSTCEVIFEDVEVHANQVLGEIGKGYKIAIELLNEGRIGIAAQMLGLAQGCFDATIPYMGTRQQFGKAIIYFQGMQFQVAEARVKLEAARLLTYNAARLRESGQPFLTEAAMAKLYTSTIAEEVASQCVEWCGGVGFTKDFPQEKFYRDAKIGRIYEGTSNLQRQTIAYQVMKQFGIKHT